MVDKSCTNHKRNLVIKPYPAICAAVLTTAICAPLVTANPLGGEVVQGSATIRQSSPSRIDIQQQTHKAILDWRGFDIDAGERTSFQQPSTSSVTLNRVNSQNASQINGRLTSNGQLFLINQNGVVFGETAQVNVGGLTATTTDINNENFMRGQYQFDQASTNPDARVTNKGRIEITEGGTAILAAPRVSNEGTINARLGKVGMVGANTFTVDFHGDGLIQFDVGSEIHQSSEEAILTNTGSIIADGGVVEMTARTADTVVDRVINMDGLIQAQSVEQREGKIILSGGDHGIVAVSGTLDARGVSTGHSGGDVKVLGDKVGLFDGTEIDVSGEVGGGEVLIGGNYQGNGTEQNAKRTYVATNTRIKADATTQGDGGKVVVWADEVTRYHGAISAQGGEQQGDGGQVEVSGKENLVFDGEVNTLAKNGEIGTLLLDPTNLLVSDDSVAFGTFIALGFNLDQVDEFDDIPRVTVGETSLIHSSYLNDAATNVTLQATNDISFDADILITAANVGITAQAGNDININKSISTDGGNLIFEADSPSTPTEGSTPAGSDGIGKITISENPESTGPLTVISTNGGDISLTGADINIDIEQFPLGFGPVTIDSGSGNISLNSQRNITLANGANISTSTGDISLIGSTVFLSGQVEVESAVTASVPRVPVSLKSGTGGVSINSQENITLRVAEIISSTGNLNLSADSDGDNIGTISIIDSLIETIAGGDINLTSAGLIFSPEDLSNSISQSVIKGQGSLTLQPSLPDAQIGIGDDSLERTFLVSNTDISSFTDGFSSIIIGREDGQHDITVRDATFRDPVEIRTPIGGSIEVWSSSSLFNPGLVGVDNASITLTGSGATTTLFTDIVTAGQAITINDSVELSTVTGNVILDTTNQGGIATGADISVSGNINTGQGTVASLPSQNLALTSGQGQITLGNVGDVRPLASVTATGSTINLQNVTTTGNQLYTGQVNLNGSYRATNNAGFTVIGNTQLASDTEVRTNGNGINFSGTVNGPKNLTLTAGSNDIIFSGDVGNANPLGLITIEDANDIQIDDRFIGGASVFNYSGVANSSNIDALRLESLSLSQNTAQGATLFGTVAGASAEAAALTVTGPVNNSNFTINGCVIGVSCFTPVDPVIPPSVDPIIPPSVDKKTIFIPGSQIEQVPGDQISLLGTSENSVQKPQLWEVRKRRPPSNDPTDPQFSNFGNEELWSDRDERNDNDTVQ